jgi:hypothetical protein
VALGEEALAIRRAGVAAEDTLLLVVNLRGTLRLDWRERPETAAPEGCSWSILLDTEDARYGGPGTITLIADSSTVELVGPRAVALRAARESG